MKFEWKYFKGRIKLCREVIFSRLNLQTDFAGYAILLEHIKRHELYRLEGDAAEIGAFMGGGTRKLGKFFRRYGKNVIVVDVFDPESDHTKNERGEEMSYIYQMILGKRDLIGIFKRNIAHLSNVIVNRIDSKQMVLNHDTKLCFSIIDGNHDPEYVRHDFELVWARTVDGGTVAMHDYGGDLPQVTSEIDGLINEHKDQIGAVETKPKHCFVFIRKLGGIVNERGRGGHN